MLKGAHRLGFSMVLVAMLLPACGEKQSTGQERTYVRVPLEMVTPEFTMKHDFIVDHRRNDNFVLGYMPVSSLATLQPQEREALIELGNRDWARVDFNIDTLQILDEELPGDDAFEGYHNYEQLTAELQQLAAAHSDIAKLESAGRSAAGRELWYMRISDNVATEENEPKLLYIANMHGDEVVGRELMIYQIRRLLTDYETDVRVGKLVDNAQIFIMPSMNPDGFESGQRWNRSGSDLNRNFPDFTSDPNDRPGSRQVETKAVMALHDRHHFVLAINFHGGAVCFNLPWDTRANNRTELMFGDDPLISALGREYANANQTMRNSNGGSFNNGLTYGYEWYEVDGGMQDWANYWRRSIHATVELSTVKWPSASALPGMWQENKESLLRYLEQGTRGAHLKVTDSSGNPLTAPITITNGRRTLTYATPYINRPTLGVAQSITLKAPGFVDQTVQITPDYFAGQYAPVTMESVSTER